jgi:transcriptional/translational regulatory protein YebC/TACO1
MVASLEAGAEDIVTNADGSIDVFTSPEDYSTVKDALDAAGLEAESAQVTMHPDTTVSLDVDDAQKAINMIEAFEDLDDVQEVYSNADFSDEVMAQLNS